MKSNLLSDFKIYEDLILICINNTFSDRRDVYSSVRCAWRMSKKEVLKRNLVLAYYKGTIVGAYRPEIWIPATHENFPELPLNYNENRIGFYGSEALDVWDQYVGRKFFDRKFMSRRPFIYLDAHGA